MKTRQSAIEIMAKEIGSIISISRRARKIKQSDLAIDAGIGISTMVAIEKGCTKVQLGHYLSAINALGIASPMPCAVNTLADSHKETITFMAEQMPKRVTGKRKSRFN